MHHVSASISGLLKTMAELLPQVQVSTVEIHKITGAEILAWNTIEGVNGAPIVPEQVYDWRYPVIMPANHYRRMRRKYRRKGIPGVRQYLDWVISLQDAAEPIPVLVALQETLKEMDEENGENGAQSQY